MRLNGDQHFAQLTLKRRMSLSYRNQSTGKSIDWFLYERDIGR